MVGLRDCMWAGASGAVGQLLIQDGVVLQRAVCGADGYLAVEGDWCPLCGRVLRRTPDVVDELV